jgi:hypothetical protein
MIGSKSKARQEIRRRCRMPPKEDVATLVRILRVLVIEDVLIMLLLLLHNTKMKAIPHLKARFDPQRSVEGNQGESKPRKGKVRSEVNMYLSLPITRPLIRQ